MIRVERLSKSYKTKSGRTWVLRDLDFEIGEGRNIGFLGKNGAGKSTLIRMLGGADYPCKGRVVRECRVSWPLALSSGYQGSMSGEDNVRFVCKVFGERDISKVQRFVKDFAELGRAFYEPVKTYSSGMRSKFAFGVSLAFDFDVYLIDEVTSVGDASFRSKCREAFGEKAKRRQVIMVSHDLQELKAYCNEAALVRGGRVEFFKDMKEAIDEYKKL